MMTSLERSSLKISCTLCLLVFFLFWGRIACSAGLRVMVLDVGMGQSVLLEEDGHGLLVDTGLAEQAPYVLARMKSYGVQKLDYLVLSHLHPDHAGGYFHIRQSWPGTPVLDNCPVPKGITLSDRELLGEIHTSLERDPLHGCLAAGDTLHWQNNQLQVLWPTASSGKTLNANSLVLLLSTEQGGTLLLMGDVDRSVESRLAATLKSSLQGKRIDLYVAAHHAAADSTDPGFLSVLQPKFSLVSVGQNNPYGYPAAEAMATLEKYSGSVLRTDRDGEICFVLEDSGAVPCKPLLNIL